MTIRYLSLFSGIEAATQAWHPLGWVPVAFAEVDPFACSVLKHHYPTIPNLGDVTKITEQQIRDLGQVDLVVFGSPCQDLSVAGKRAGLEGKRSGLFYDAMRIVRWTGSRFALFENVPGVFSSKRGEDFAAVVGEMAGAEPDVPKGGWAKAGALLGRDALVEWCVLDAQYFGVPQRRRRVFALRDTGDWRSRPPLLLESEGMHGHPPPRRQTRQDVTYDVAPCLAASGRGFERPGDTRGQDCLIPSLVPTAFGGGRTNGPLEVSTTLVAKGQKCDFEVETFIAHSLRADGFDASEDGTGCGIPLLPVCFSCKDSGADASDIAPTLRAGGHSGSHANARVMPAIAYAFAENQRAEVVLSETAPCLKVGGGKPGQGYPAALAFNLRGREGGSLSEPDDLASLRAARGGSSRSYLATQMAVRRLTPTECERLQGFPDNFTSVPHRGKPAADGPRYRALGNSMAVPVMAWIGQRIQLIDNLSNTLQENECQQES